jgi:hypothetical protein
MTFINGQVGGFRKRSISSNFVPQGVTEEET